MRLLKVGGLVLAAATVGAIALPTAAAADDDVYFTELNLPESIPGTDGSEASEVEWAPEIFNGEEGDSDDHLTTLTITAGYADGSAPDLSMVSNDGDCKAANETTMVCETMEFYPGSMAFDLGLVADSDGEYRDEPVLFTAELVTGGYTAEPVTGEVTIVPDERFGRLVYDIPETISSDLVEGTEGVKAPITVTNNTDETLSDVKLFVYSEWDGEPSLVFGHEGDECEADGPYLTCPIDSLAPGDVVEFDMTVYVAEKWQSNPNTGVSSEIRGPGNLGWAERYEYTEIVEADGDVDKQLPVTGSGMTMPILFGVAALAVAGGMFALSRRRKQN